MRLKVVGIPFPVFLLLKSRVSHGEKWGLSSCIRPLCPNVARYAYAHARTHALQVGGCFLLCLLLFFFL